MADYTPVNGANQGDTATFTAGASITGGQVLVFTGPDTVSPAAGASQAVAGVAGHDAASGAQVTVFMGAGVVHETPSGLPPAPPAPGLSQSGTGTVPAGTYTVETTYVSAAGESMPGPSAAFTVSGSTSNLVVASPPAAAGATGWYAYVSQAGGSSMTRQQTAGSPTAIGANYTVTTTPSATGAAPPTGTQAGALLATAAGGLVASGATAGSEVGVAVRPVAASTGLLRWKATKG